MDALFGRGHTYNSGFRLASFCSIWFLLGLLVPSERALPEPPFDIGIPTLPTRFFAADAIVVVIVEYRRQLEDKTEDYLPLVKIDPDALTAGKGSYDVFG